MENGLDDEPLYDPQLLQDIDWSSRKCSLRNDVSPSHPGPNLVMRPLNSGDYDRGFMNILNQLTSIGEVSKTRFHERFEAMKQSVGTYYITVLEDTSTSEIIASSSLIIEQKFIHSCNPRGRIEDVVVNSDYRGKQLGKLLVETSSLLGKHLGCYKMSLECKEENIKFYQSFGYSVDGQSFMVQRYKD